MTNFAKRTNITKEYRELVEGFLKALDEYSDVYKVSWYKRSNLVYLVVKDYQRMTEQVRAISRGDLEQPNIFFAELGAERLVKNWPG